MINCNRKSFLVGKAGIVVFATALSTFASASPQVNVALGKPVTVSGFYDNGGTEVFPGSNITDGRLDDTGTPGNWSFWLTPQGTVGTATIDLGSPFALNSFQLQDTHNRRFFDRGTQDFTISTSLNGLVYTQQISDSFSLAARNNLSLLTEILGSPVNARFVRFDAVTAWGASAGLNEFRAFGTPTPEPATVAVFGIGAIGLFLRRKKA